MISRYIDLAIAIAYTPIYLSLVLYDQVTQEKTPS